MDRMQQAAAGGERHDPLEELDLGEAGAREVGAGVYMRDIGKESHPARIMHLFVDKGGEQYVH